jgi:hypothetical protein
VTPTPKYEWIAFTMQKMHNVLAQGWDSKGKVQCLSKPNMITQHEILLWFAFNVDLILIKSIGILA